MLAPSSMRRELSRGVLPLSIPPPASELDAPVDELLLLMPTLAAVSSGRRASVVTWALAFHSAGAEPTTLLSCTPVPMPSVLRVSTSAAFVSA